MLDPHYMYRSYRYKSTIKLEHSKTQVKLSPCHVSIMNIVGGCSHNFPNILQSVFVLHVLKQQIKQSIKTDCGLVLVMLLQQLFVGHFKKVNRLMTSKCFKHFQNHIGMKLNITTYDIKSAQIQSHNNKNKSGIKPRSATRKLYLSAVSNEVLQMWG